MANPIDKAIESTAKPIARILRKYAAKRDAYKLTVFAAMDERIEAITDKETAEVDAKLALIDPAMRQLVLDKANELIDSAPSDPRPVETGE